MGPLLQSEMSISLVLCLNVVLLGRIIDERGRNSLYDPLTGIPNRILFMERLESAHGRAKREKRYLFAVVFLDLDRFKVLNDKFGHIIGDRFLIHTAKRLTACLRPGDIAARLGGDEFAILLDKLGEPAQAHRIGTEAPQGTGRALQFARAGRIHHREHRDRLKFNTLRTARGLAAGRRHGHVP